MMRSIKTVISLLAIVALLMVANACSEKGGGDSAR